MCAIVLEESIRIPNWVTDLGGFRRWAHSDEFPERGWFSFLDGDVWVDLTRERVVENLIKGQVVAVLSGLIYEAKSGRFLNRILLTNSEAGLSTEPDGTFISYESIKSGQVTLEEGLDSIEVIGSPDMTLEVISRKSVKKDTEILRDLYWRAGIREYWLIDSRISQPVLEILRHTARGYVSTRQQAGWVKSAVFGKSFRLTQRQDELGEAEFTLEVR